MLLERIREYSIILASGSPRRQELLGSAGFTFQLVADLEVEETYPDALSGKQIPGYLAVKKSEAYPWVLGARDILITADTVVCQGTRILEKPVDGEDARTTLRMISGKSHHVYTGVCLRSAAKRTVFVAATEVRFGSLSEEEINYYIQHYQPFDKAGAYGIQEWIGYIGVEEIRGSYFNVMGLPVHKLYRELEAFLT
ncbi:MAG: Maf family nucleotide pyrophosphatase [Bacteroidales bacterium]|nr:Maf family nucleotide pyrophosphatase [Bacteroidales bacterium]MDT8431349.1 Maf family nucleotide pyrophosphatase [Bacteroidales bacterium]